MFEHPPLVGVPGVGALDGEAGRPRSEQELRTRLTSKGFSDDVLEHVVRRLRELKLLDDQAFAAYWVEQRQSRVPRGRRLIDRELRMKGVAVETVADELGVV